MLIDFVLLVLLSASSWYTVAVMLHASISAARLAFANATSLGPEILGYIGVILRYIGIMENGF